MTWAARYSATDEPELTIYRDGVEVLRESDMVRLERVITKAPCRCRLGAADPSDGDVWRAIWHDNPLRADITARVDLRECDRPGCAIHAIGQGLCVLHGGRDEL